jgi:hypothetical protein
VYAREREQVAHPEIRDYFKIRKKNYFVCLRGKDEKVNVWGMKGSCGGENCCFSFQNGANHRRRCMSFPFVLTQFIANYDVKDDDVEYFQLIK